jgi:hypothetical protein
MAAATSTISLQTVHLIQFDHLAPSAQAAFSNHQPRSINEETHHLFNNRLVRHRRDFFRQDSEQGRDHEKGNRRLAVV